jgi:peptide subunit release factor 1 (eRF1)
MNCDFLEVKNIILAYPINFKNEFSKCSFVIDELINNLPLDINIQIVITDEAALYQLNNMHPDKTFQPLIIENGTIFGCVIA